MTNSPAARFGAGMEPLISDYVTWLRSWGASERTISARSTLAAARLKEWGPDGFTVDNLTAFLAGLKTPWTRATYHSHLTCFCTWRHATERAGSNPMVTVRKPTRPQSAPRPLSEPDVVRVLAAAQGRQHDWIMLALLAGLRASEIAKLRGEDVNADGIYVLGKGGKIVTLPCHPDLWDIAQRYPRQGYWFPGVEEGEHLQSQQISLHVGKLFKSLGIEGSIHRCRHVFGTRLLRSGTNIRTVQKLMRHANLDTTAAYTAVDEDELRAAINLLVA